MLDLSVLLVAWSAPLFIGIEVTLTKWVDSSNDRANRPIPVACEVY